VQKSDPNSSFSLYGLLNKARTPMGKRLLLTWLKQPLLDVVQVMPCHSPPSATNRNLNI
jgi:DNA mismatch repair protein MSH2